jgi:hypothetical protein
MLDYAEDIAATSRRNEGLTVLAEAKSILDAAHDESELRGHLLLEYARFYSFIDVERSRTYAEQTLEFYRQHYPTAMKRLGAVSLLALADWHRGEYADAERRFTELAGELKHISVPDVAAVIATSLKLAAVRADRLEITEAERELRRILDESRRVNGETHLNTVTAQARLGALLPPADAATRGAACSRLPSRTSAKERPTSRLM